MQYIKMNITWKSLFSFLYVFLLVSLFWDCHKPEKPSEVPESKPIPFNPLKNQATEHLDHTPFFKDKVKTPQEITNACLECHPKAADEVMKTAHWTWLSGDIERNGKDIKIGKRNQMNNFCISVIGNWKSCTACHAGYGWGDDKFDFTKKENVDCLVCHEGTGSYVKGKMGMPKEGVDLAASAGSVRLPKRENCGACHFSGGGGMGVKHGDLDESLINPNEHMDVHMGRLNFQCSDCHKAKEHFIPGKVNATYTAASHYEKMSCDSCHTTEPHSDSQLNKHVSKVACQTCHIPEFARKLPTKMIWDWSQAGDGSIKEDTHEYLKIKGRFKYGEDVQPEYAWFNGKMDRYVNGDKIPASVKELYINEPLGDRNDPNARIWPFKIHRAKQIFDPINRVLIPPLTSGEGGFWNDFDWNYAATKGMEMAGLPYSGKYGFLPTRMYWTTNHMVPPGKDALKCTECHSPDGRLDWKALGYDKDPAGGRGMTHDK